MKALRFASIVLAAGLLAGCASSAPSSASGNTVTLTVFAAASLQETLTEAAELYRQTAPGVEILYNFDSSGTLKTQIEEGADCDIFLSAGQKQMDQLVIGADPSVNTDGLDFVDDTTRLDILENKVTLCVPEGNLAGITSFDVLSERLAAGDVLMAMGNEDVPVGQYTQNILAWYGLDEAALAREGCLTYGSNVKEVTSQITEGAVDCGVIYCTDAYSAGLTPVDYATEEMCGQVIYPAAVLKTSAHPDEARAFLDFLCSDEVGRIFESVGFTALA